MDDAQRHPPEQRVFHSAGRYDPLTLDPDSDLAPPETNYTVTDLQPYTVYELRVISENSLGKAPSDWMRARTAEAGTWRFSFHRMHVTGLVHTGSLNVCLCLCINTAPIEVPSPEVMPLSKTELNITWPMATERQSRGVVTSYTVYHYAMVDQSINVFAPSMQWEVRLHFLLHALYPICCAHIKRFRCR